MLPLDPAWTEAVTMKTVMRTDTKDNNFLESVILSFQFLHYSNWSGDLPQYQRNFMNSFIEVVKKTFRYTIVFLLQPLMPPFIFPEHNYEKRY